MSREFKFVGALLGVSYLSLFGIDFIYSIVTKSQPTLFANLSAFGVLVRLICIYLSIEYIKDFIWGENNE